MQRTPLSVSILLVTAGLAFAQGKPTTPRPQATPAPPPPVLQGIVRGPDGKPIADALVTARPVDASFSDPVLATRTDASGAFRLELKKPGLVNVRIEAKGLAPQILDRTRPGAPLAVTLAKGGVLTGVVRDGTTGTPLEGVRVEATNAKGLVPTWEPVAGAARDVTDAEGRFRLEGLGNGLHLVTARARGFTRASQDSVRPGGKVELFLFPGSSIVGVVRDGNKKPVAGALVRAESTFRGRRRQDNPVETTDARGRFEIAGLRAGTYVVLARHPAFASGLVPGITLETGSESTVDVVLGPAARLSGRLVGPNEQPVRGSVRFQEMFGEPAPSALDDTLRAEAGTDGRFRLDGVPPGAHALLASAHGLGGKRVDVDIREGSAETDIGDVVFEAGLSIRGRVRDKAGAKVADALIRAHASGTPSPPVEERSEPDGTFVVGGLNPGAYSLRTSAPGFAATNTSTEAGAEKVDIVLEAAGVVTGVVVDDADKALDGFWIRTQTGDPNSADYSESMESFGNPEGRFVLADLPPGSHTLAVTSPDRVAARVSSVVVRAGATTDVGRIRLTAGGSVRGAVVDTSGAPIPGASIRAVRGQTEEGSSVSDAAGEFEVRGLSRGPTTLFALHPSYAIGRTPGIEIDPARGPAEARVVLSGGGRIEGTVRRRDGRGMAAKVLLSSLRRDADYSPFEDLLWIGPDGAFGIDHVAPGRVRVLLMIEADGRLRSRRQAEVEVRDGETTTVDLSIREVHVSGRVARFGQPAPNMRVTVHGEGEPGYVTMSGTGSGTGGPQMMTGTTREDGSFELLVDSPGPKRVTVSTADRKMSLPMRRVEIPDAETHTLDLSFSGVMVEGIAVDKQTEQPVPRASVWAVAKTEPGGPGGGADAGPDGRFRLELEPGEYRLVGYAEEYAEAEGEVSVGGGGAADVRLAFSRGVSLRGRVVDEGRRGLANVSVMSMPAEGSASGDHDGFTQSAVDGSFVLHGLQPRPQNLLASVTDLFGVLMAAVPGEKEVLVTLRPGGLVALRVLGPDGTPAARASARVTKLDNRPVGGLLSPARTDAQGSIELRVPAGTLEIAASKDGNRGSVVVQVTPGGAATAEIRLAAPAQQRAAPQ